MPGPGHYPSKTLIGTESPGKSMAMRYKIKFEEPGANNVPGPGSYKIDTSSITNKDPTWRIGTS